MSIRLRHELGECAVAVDAAQAVPAALARMRVASGVPRPVEEYVFEYVDVSGETRVLGEESGTLGEAGIVGCDEVVDMRMHGMYAARAQLAACGEDVYEWVVPEGGRGWYAGGHADSAAVREMRRAVMQKKAWARRQVKEAAERALAAGRGGRERLQLLAAAEVPRAGFVADLAGEALAEELARAGQHGEGAAELLESCREIFGDDAMGAALLQAARRVDEDGRTAMSRAELVRVLVLAGAPLDFQDGYGSTALMTACLDGQAEAAAALINEGAALDVQGVDGNTALMEACGEGLVDVAELLINKGAALDTQDMNGDTALMEACLDGRTAVAELLINKGAALDVQGEDGRTALMYACRCSYTEVVEALISAGAALDIQDQGGCTALICACNQRHTAIARALIKKGAAVDVQARDGRTALLSACEKGDFETAALLVSRGAALDGLNLSPGEMMRYRACLTAAGTAEVDS